MNVRVTGDLVFVRPTENPTRSEAGLHLVYDNQYSTWRGTVVAIGEGPRTRTGTLLPHLVHVGDEVIFGKDSGEELIFQKETIIAIREQDVLAVVEG